MKQCFYMILFTFLLPQIAAAHPIVFDSQGFSGGFSHPLTGIDHLLAMLAIGLMASQQQHPFRIFFPLTFLICMSIGGVFGLMGIAIPFVELGISLSLVALGLLIVFPTRLPNLFILGLIMLFAICHGHAHGHEMSGNFSANAYAGGFLLATAGIHLFGYLLGRLLHRFMISLLPVIGTGIALSVLWI